MLAGCSMLPWAEMSDEEAGEKYLAAICPSNSALERWSEAHSAYVDDPTAGFAGAIEAAAGVRDSAQAAAQALESDQWPEDVAEDIGKVQESLYVDVSNFDNLAGAETADEYDRTNRIEDPNGGAAQAVRSGLGLSADTTGSCGVEE
tara:strand:- start:3610 stop:4050 length:441 start_codon:yes stop_codon:yes gene_type:complete